MAFLFKLETRDGLPAEPSTLSVAVPNMRVDDVIRLLTVRDVQDPYN